MSLEPLLARLLHSLFGLERRAHMYREVNLRDPDNKVIPDAEFDWSDENNHDTDNDNHDDTTK